ILTQTERIETVMTFMEVEPELSQLQQAAPRYPAEATCLQTGTLMVLWFFVLLAQLFLLWQSQKKS
ncbi:MAG: hypothetical protein SXA11_14880, partial [Cyanobacteriota bacterium]|nr:hypothetical protein [Cyanobacteriota bacterium]